MQLKKYNRAVPITSLKITRVVSIKRLCLIVFTCFVVACDDFVDVDLPKNQITSEAVFDDVVTATAPLKSIYAKMRDEGLTSSLNKRIGLYADELDPFNLQDIFYDHTILSSDGTISNWWRHTYNLIYTANTVVEGVENATALSLEDKNQLKGEALFIRGYLHALLVDLFGPIPYVKTTDYTINTIASRMPVADVYNEIINDLVEASDLLSEDISESPEVRIRPHKVVAEALLSRVYLYTKQWELAEEKASTVISEFVLEPDLNKVFLKDASGTIWQFKPESEGDNTREGANFIFTGNPGAKPVLTPSFLTAFEANDQRSVNWIGSTSSGFYPYKYKERINTGISKEYSVMFRLAEQYLIRSEARAQRGNISGAQSDLNMIRNRAGLPNTTATTTNDLLEAILHERQVELFTEGHRWFDLKRTAKASEVLTPLKPNWRDTNILFPIPDDEILINPNLLPQNGGY